jgi:hypothetical protein
MNISWNTPTFVLTNNNLAKKVIDNPEKFEKAQIEELQTIQ